VNACDKEKETALHWAALLGHLPTVQLLVEHGAAVRVRNRRGETPVNVAELAGYMDVTGFLREAEREEELQAREQRAAAAAAVRPVCVFLRSRRVCWELMASIRLLRRQLDSSNTAFTLSCW
jgi:ankyrin repeat protein